MLMPFPVQHIAWIDKTPIAVSNHAEGLLVVEGPMFDVNNGPPNFPILAHSINIYYLQPIYENMGSESGVSLSILRCVEF